ncbi:MAG TPA: SDR family NAD(P)-dependent oxidoreductase, partial [Solirubrobacterales bacterium]|nr:SDR family NAD(P)-dependent oxidoreductase [Solirubrobacterales bacterium]
DVNLLINNAGAAAFAPPLSADPTGVEREMATNFGGTYAMIRAWAPLIEANGGGAIVDVLSTAGLAGIPAFAGYSASKAVAHSLTQSVRATLVPGESLYMTYTRRGSGRNAGPPRSPTPSQASSRPVSSTASRPKPRTSFPAASPPQSQSSTPPIPKPCERQPHRRSLAASL